MTWAAAYTYFGLLALLSVVAAKWGPRPMARTMLAIAGNCLLANVWTISNGGGEPWALFMVLDAVSARIVLWQPAGRPQALVGMMFIAKLGMSTGYALNGVHADPLAFWWLLTIAGFIQLLLVGGWLVQWSGILSIRGHGKVAPAARPQGLER